MDGPQQHAVEFPFHNVDLAEVIKIKTDNIEYTHWDERKTVNEQYFLKLPPFQLGDSAEKHQDKTVSGYSSQYICE